jgi:hypothetical protein
LIGFLKLPLGELKLGLNFSSQTRIFRHSDNVIASVLLAPTQQGIITRKAAVCSKDNSKRWSFSANLSDKPLNLFKTACGGINV